MRLYNYDNLPQDEHVFHMWEPLNFQIKDDYQYVPKSFIFNFVSNILCLPISFLLIIIDKVLFGFKLENRDKLLYNTGYVSISNHIHVMDCTMIAISIYPRRVYFPTLQSNFNIPIIRDLIRILYAIPIPKTAKQKNRFYEQLNSVLDNDRIVHMYPEGSMWPYYEKVRDFKIGAFKIAVDANKPIVPIKFVLREPKGIYKFYKKKKCIHAIVLDPIYPNNDLDYRERVDDLKNRSNEALREDF